jgi:tetratricopeptide (TPR) repeat protein
VDKSLIQAEGVAAVRYRLLETIRDYATSKLSETGVTAADEIRKAHRDYFLSLAEAAAPHVSGPDQVEWLDRLELELDNFRLALSYCLVDPDPRPGLRLSTSLSNFWFFRDHVVEGAAAICAQVDRPEAFEESALRGRALVIAGNLMAIFTPDLGASLDRAHDGLSTGRASGDDHLVAQALHVLAIVSGRKGDFRAAFNFADEGLRITPDQTDADLAARLHMVRANTLVGLGEDPRSDYEQALTLFRAAGNSMAANLVLNNIGYDEICAGQLEAARLHLDESLRMARQLGHRIGISYSSYNRGLVAHLEGDDVTARQMFVESLNIAFQSHELSEVADALFGLALTHSHSGSLHMSTVLHGAADAIYDEFSGLRLDLQSRLRTEDQKRLLDLMGDAAFAAAYDEGRAMSVEDSVTLAVS